MKEYAFVMTEMEISYFLPILRYLDPDKFDICLGNIYRLTPSLDVIPSQSAILPEEFERRLQDLRNLGFDPIPLDIHKLDRWEALATTYRIFNDDQTLLPKGQYPRLNHSVCLFHDLSTPARGGVASFLLSNGI